jgi:lysophospholipase L1-like esterase
MAALPRRSDPASPRPSRAVPIDAGPTSGPSAAPRPALTPALAHGRRQAEAAIRARAVLARGKRAGAAGLLVAEGDSWFDYPFHSVLTALERRFGFEVESVAHHGDRAEEMAYDGAQLAGVARLFERLSRHDRRPRAILLSAGGNDVVGSEFRLLLNHRESGLPPLSEPVVRGVVDERVRFALGSVLGALTELSRRYFGEALPIVLHGYDYPVPDGRGYLGGFWLLPGPWMEPGFRQKGYHGLAERMTIARALIDRFNAVLATLPGERGLGHLRYADLRGTLSCELRGGRYRRSWENELHPTARGFERIAARLASAIP